MDTRHSPFISARSRPFARHGFAPLGSEFVVVLAILFSLLFILSASLAFVNPELGPVFRDTLNVISAQQAGIVLLGESVDVDIDEPSVTIRWSVLGCGTGFILPGSPKLHDSLTCGVLAIPLEVFIDDSDTSIFTYDPESVPTNLKTSQRVIVQAQVQFDGDLVLDVHDSRLYPYDTYLVSTSLRATTSNSSMKDIPVPIIGLPVLEYTTSFTISSDDTDVLVAVEEEKAPGRHLEIRIRRPGHARVYAMLIFGINWVLCHFCFGIVFLSVVQSGRAGTKEVLKQLAGALAVLLVIPQLRGAMPDAPGFDGVLIDVIGYFPQMTLVGLSVIVLLLITAKRELDNMPEKESFPHHYKTKSTRYEPLSSGSRTLEDGCLASTIPKGLPVVSNRVQGHSRNLSARDFMLEQVLSVLDAGSQAFRNSSLGGSNSTGRSHLRSRSHHERKVA